MAKLSISISATGSTTLISSYDQNKWSLGTLIKQYTGPTTTDNFIGPYKVAQARPFEEQSGVQLLHIDGFAWSSRYDWIFGIENLSTAVATRRILSYIYDRETSSYVYKGFIWVTLNTSTANTTRGFKMTYYTYTTGTVAVSTTSVSGTNTLFQTQRIGVGSRIGFGTTDPTQVTQWYYISSISSDTSLSISLSAGTIPSGTSYVIEELRPVIVTTNSTLTNGGVYVAKGISFDDFTQMSTLIAASAGSTDNLKLVYWFKDAATVTNTISVGGAVDGTVQRDTNGLTHSLYVIDQTSKVYVYNLRSNDTVASGIKVMTSGNIYVTGTQSISGSYYQNNNATIITASHSTGAGVKSLYWTTSTRFYRADLNSIKPGSIFWQSESRSEIPPGGVTTMPVSSNLAQVDYDQMTDMFFCLTNNLSAAKSYYTKYPLVSGDPFDYSFLNDFKLLDGSTSDPNSIPIPFNTNSTPVYTNCINGITHMLRFGTAAIGGQSLFAVPISAHWDFTSYTNQVAISPVINTPNNNRFVQLSLNTTHSLGSNQWLVTLNDIRSFYRTSGISNNSGLWNAIPSSGELSISGTNQIQFKFEFSMLGHTYGIPGRIHGFSLIYEDESTDSHYQPSVTWSDSLNKRFAWRFSTAFGQSVPSLRVRLYDAISGGLLVDDNTLTPSGTFEQSINDGVSWSSWTNSDKSNNITYLRYTPSSLADNIKIRALLTQY